MRHLLTQLKNQGYYLNGIKTWLSPTNNLLITYLSPTNHLLKSRAHRCTQFAVALLVMAVLSVGNVWGETAVATSAGTYSFGSTNIGAANKFAELSTNSVYIFRYGAWQTGNSGIKGSSNLSGFVFYLTSPMNLSTTVYQSNSISGNTATFYIKTITSDFFQSLVDGTANSTVLSNPSFTAYGSFSETSTITSSGEFTAAYGTTLTAGYYYVYAQTPDNLYHRKITLTVPACSAPTITEGTTRTSFAGGSWAQNSGHNITVYATGADSYEWYRNTSATDAGATKLSETSNTLDITADVAVGTYFFKAVAKSGACSSSTEWGWCGAMTITTAGCPNYSFHTGGDDVKTNNTQSCFVQVGSSHEWQLTDYTIPADTKFFVGERGWWYNDNLGSNNSRSSAQTWAAEMYLAKSFDSGDAEGSPKLGPATGAVGTVRIYDNSDWNNLNAAFIPDGYVLKFGSSYGLFTEGPTNEFLSPLVTYNSTTAGYAVSVGVTDGHDDYVSTANTQEMRHIFLKDNCGWSADGAKFAIYYWSGDNNGWCGFLQTVPEATNLYEGWIPASYTNLKFVRFSSSKTVVGTWDDKWNETSDLSVTSSQNYFTMSSFSSGSWSAYQKKGKFRINANYKDKNWFVRFIPNYILTYD